MRFTKAALLLAVTMMAFGTLAITSVAVATGPPGGTIYAHDVAYRTVATPTDLPMSGNFDVIYALGGDLAAVSESAPGDADYNGGRWEVRLITWVTISPTQFTNAEDIHAAAAAGEIEISDPVRYFVCPLIRQ